MLKTQFLDKPCSDTSMFLIKFSFWFYFWSNQPLKFFDEQKTFSTARYLKTDYLVKLTTSAKTTRQTSIGRHWFPQSIGCFKEHRAILKVLSCQNCKKWKIFRFWPESALDLFWIIKIKMVLPNRYKSILAHHHVVKWINSWWWINL